MYPQFAGLFAFGENKLQVNSERSVTLNLSLGLFTSISLFRKARRVTDSKVRRLDFTMSILVTSFSLVLETLIVFSVQKNRPAVRVVGQIFFN